MESLLFRMSGLYADEGWNSDGKELDFRKLKSINSYCSDEAVREISSALYGMDLPVLRWIDSGDYHYLSYILAENISEPFSLLLLDNHPDDQNSAFGTDILSCGNWVAALRRDCPTLKDVCWNSAESLPGQLPVYVSLDLDVMDPEFFRTNWNQGKMTPSELKSELSFAFRHRVLAVDVCGGLTVAKGADASALSLNRDFRRRLHSFIASSLQNIF